jgi:DNA-binding protein HU-beta
MDHIPQRGGCINPTPAGRPRRQGGLTVFGLEQALDRIRPASAPIADPLCPLQEITMPLVKKASRATGNKVSAAKPVAQATVTLKHLAAALAEDHEVPKKQAEAVLGDLVTLTTKHLKKGNKIRLTGIGIFQVRRRAARMGRNPATGEAVKIKASRKVAFRPAKELKEGV